ncbi:tetratricopeptide repeat protein [Exiguobacterium sp. KRL4]|uniref:tetratricopeptide repeat protein n=1 Tax=Exiguobacterium sp. KRL4 TaxID=1914536 RepID=UPI0009F5463E|nr:tetratricopeptide repeat protein [Exiguobacterium sp. KRL4]
MTFSLEIQTDRLTIRPLDSSDYPDCLAASLVPVGSTASDFKTVVETQQRLAADDLEYHFGVFRTEDGLPLGKIILSTLARNDFQWARIDYTFPAPSLDEYGAEALTAVHTLAFDHLHFHRIELQIDPSRQTSLALAERLGMQEEGIRHQFLAQHGTWIDQRIFVSLRQERTTTQTRPHDWEQVRQLRQTNHYADAKKLVASYLDQTPDDPFVNYQMAWCHDSLGEEAAAVPYYVQAIDAGLSAPDLQQAYVGLGSTYRALGRYEEAYMTLTEGLTHFPDHPALQTFLALTLYNLDRSSESISLLVKTLVGTTHDADIRTYRRALRFYAEHLEETWDS